MNINKNYILAICVLVRARWRPSTTLTKQGPGKAENEWTRDWERSTARDESGARSQWFRGVIPDQSMFVQTAQEISSMEDAAAANSGVVC